MEVVASLYSNNLKELIKAVKNVFIPITVGGGIRSIEDAYEIYDLVLTKSQLTQKLKDQI